MTAVVHTFDPSNHSDGASWWEVAYRRAFGSRYVSHSVVSDRDLQRAGIDHDVELAGGQHLLVDCKTRDCWRDDILVEVWSARETKSAGWAIKDLRCHYVAYAYPQQEVMLLVPFNLLQRAYQRNKTEWARLCGEAGSGFSTLEVPNRGSGGSYTTVSVLVPWQRFLRDVAEAMVVYFDPALEPFAPKT